MPRFVCNVCGSSNEYAGAALSREAPGCKTCGSSLRTRGLLHALSMELFGTPLPLPDFPRVPSLRGLGTSDSNQYAGALAEKFDYRNTFFDREPRFDITQAPESESGRYDFLISSEVLEHVVPPASQAFDNAFRMLQPHGVLVFTVPYELDSPLEHYPELHEYGLADVGGRMVLVNRTRDGRLQTFENPVFHWSGADPALEMRAFSEAQLRDLLSAAGFAETRIYSENYPPFGIVHGETWSLPIAARKGPFAFSRDAARDIVEQSRDLRRGIDTEMRRLARRWWFRAGRKLGLL